MTMDQPKKTMTKSNATLRALTVAGFDPSGGAGVLADARTFIALGCEPAAVITSITYQNSKGVLGATHESAESVRNQLAPLLTSSFAGAKTGMLPTREVVEEVARLFRESNLPSPVVDPVMVSSSGQRLMDIDAIDTLIRELLPLCSLLTPNVPEAEFLTSMEIRSEADMHAAAAALRKQGARAVLIKGGHLPKQDQAMATSGNADFGEAIDVLDDDGLVTIYRGQRVPNVDVHGTGCMLSAAIAAGLGNALSLKDSVGRAKQFVFEFILKAADKDRPRNIVA